MLTYDSVMRQINKVLADEPAPRPNPDPYLINPYYKNLARFSAVRIFVDPNCLEETSERLFPQSQHRSRRIHKKLVKRYGGEFRKAPTMFWVGPDQVVCHPNLYRAVMLAKNLGVREFPSC